jgi:hypothetical protein
VDGIQESLQAALKVRACNLVSNHRVFDDISHAARGMLATENINCSSVNSQRCRSRPRRRKALRRCFLHQARKCLEKLANLQASRKWGPLIRSCHN